MNRYIVIKQPIFWRRKIGISLKREKLLQPEYDFGATAAQRTAFKTQKEGEEPGAQHIPEHEEEGARIWFFGEHWSTRF